MFDHNSSLEGTVHYIYRTARYSSRRGPGALSYVPGPSGLPAFSSRSLRERCCEAIRLGVVHNQKSYTVSGLNDAGVNFGIQYGGRTKEKSFQELLPQLKCT